MNALENFYASLESQCYFLTKEQLAELIKLDRLSLVLIRCGGVRMLAPAQYVETLCGYVAKAGDYVRDISIPNSERAKASAWQP